MVCIGALQVRRLVVAYGLLVQGLRHTRCGLEECSSAVRRVLRLAVARIVLHLLPLCVHYLNPVCID